MTDHLRLFFALSLPDDETRELIAAHINYLRSSVYNETARARWTKPENLHLTIKFLGAVERARLPELRSAAARAVSQVAPFSFTVSGAGAFPSVKNPRVLWLGIEKPRGWLTLLQRRLEAACAEVGFPAEERAFHPHLTVGRVSLLRTDAAFQLASTHRAKGFAPGTVIAREIHLMQSLLQPPHDPCGVRYQTVERFPFSAPTPVTSPDINSK